MGNNLVESIVGGLVLIVAGFFIYYAYNTASAIKATDRTYSLYAKFSRIDGINLGAAVKISGIPIGKVISQHLDPKTYQAVLNLSIQENIKIPTDSVAEIVGNGLLGEKYINIQAGADSEMLAANGTIEFTQSSLSLESLLGKFMFGLDKNAATSTNK